MPILSDWLTYKQQRGEAYKGQKSFDALYKKLKLLSNSDAEVARMVIEQSMASNWAGLFSLKEEKEKTAVKKERELYRNSNQVYTNKIY